MPRPKGGHYSDQEVETALRVLAEVADSEKAAEQLEQLKAAGHLDRVPTGRTLRKWRTGPYLERFEAIRDQMRPEMIDRADANARLAAEVQRKALYRLRDEIAEMKAVDLGKLLQQTGVTIGILTEKGSLLRGEPTTITGRPTTEELWGQLQRITGKPQDQAADQPPTNSDSVPAESVVPGEGDATATSLSGRNKRARLPRGQLV